MTNIEEAIQERVEVLLSGKEKEVSIPMAPLYDIASALDDNEFETMKDGSVDLDGWEINGWQYDFWWRFKHINGGEYQLSGSLWYGDFKLEKI